jgi:hypothetical protein
MYINEISQPLLPSTEYVFHLVVSVQSALSQAKFIRSRKPPNPGWADILGLYICVGDNTTMALNYLHLAHRQLKNPADRDFAVYLDSQYPTFRHEFHIPTNEGVSATDLQELPCATNISTSTPVDTRKMGSFIYA